MSDDILLEKLSDRDLLVLTVNTVNRISKDHENRIRALENFKAIMYGAWSLLLIFLGVRK